MDKEEREYWKDIVHRSTRKYEQGIDRLCLLVSEGKIELNGDLNK